MVERHQRAGQLMIRILHSDLPRGMGAMATRDGRGVTVRLSRELEPRSQRLTLSVTLKAARRAGWIRRGVPALVLFPFTGAVAWGAMRGAARKLTGGHTFLAAAGAATLAVIAAAAILLSPGARVRTPSAAPTAAPTVAVHPRRHRQQQHARRRRSRRSPVAYQLPLAQPGTASSPSPEPVPTASHHPAPQPSPVTTTPSPAPPPASPPSPSPSPSPPGHGGKLCIIVLGVVVCL